MQLSGLILVTPNLLKESGINAKLFIRVLKYFKCQPPLRLNYLSDETSLIPDLSIRKNLELDSEINFNKRNNLKLLKHFLTEVKDLHTPVKEIDLTTRKKLILSKSFLQHSPYRVYEKPENYLLRDTFNYFLDSLQQTLTENSNYIVFIVTDAPSLYKNIPYQQLTIDENKHFHIQSSDSSKESENPLSFTQVA